MATKIQTRHDTAENWESVNPVLLDGERGLEYTFEGQTRSVKEKIGDGTTAWKDLPYYSTGSSGESSGGGVIGFPAPNVKIFTYSEPTGDGVGYTDNVISYENVYNRTGEIRSKKFLYANFIGLPKQLFAPEYDLRLDLLRSKYVSGNVSHDGATVTGLKSAGARFVHPVHDYEGIVSEWNLSEMNLRSHLILEPATIFGRWFRRNEAKINSDDELEPVWQYDFRRRAAELKISRASLFGRFAFRYSIKDGESRDRIFSAVSPILRASFGEVRRTGRKTVSGVDISTGDFVFDSIKDLMLVKMES